jgi:hypothetical protein
MGLDTKTCRLTDCQSQCDFDFEVVLGEFQTKPAPDKFSASSRWEMKAVTSQWKSRQKHANKTAENNESVCEELTQCAYSKIESVVIRCNPFQINRVSKSRTH